MFTLWLWLGVLAMDYLFEIFEYQIGAMKLRVRRRSKVFAAMREK
jgi:hypothetical protein